MADYKLEAEYGNLFVNNKKELGSKQPDRTGKLCIPFDCKKGDVLDLSGWIKEGAKGKFLSLVAKEEWKPEASSHGKVSPNKATPFTDMDDDYE